MKLEVKTLNSSQILTSNHIDILQYPSTFSFQADFVAIMKNLPVEVSDQDIDEMFEFADKNKDGKLSYKEFKVMYI